MGISEVTFFRVTSVSFFLLLAFISDYENDIRNGKANILYALKNVVPILGVIAVFSYFALNHELIIRRGEVPSQNDMYMGVILVVLVLEATRRIMGYSLFLIALFLLVYTYFGPYFPMPLGHAGASISRIVGVMFMTTDGVFGIIAGLFATYVFLFITFGAFLMKTKGDVYYLDLSRKFTGKMVGGPPKTATVASALMGMISGSAPGNVAITGTFTIPTMIKSGYSRSFAGAVESVASSGGQFTPPIMGAAAFIIAEFLGIPYLEVVKRAAFPALLFYIAVFSGMHFYAKVWHPITDRVTTDEPSILSIIKRSYFFLPLFVLVYFLVRGYSPSRVALSAIASLIAVSFLTRETRLNFRTFFEALAEAAKQALPIGVVCACAGIIIGSILLTGLAGALTSIIVTFSGGNLLVALFFIMILGLILGMGMTTVAVYVILASLAIPALITLGAIDIGAHLAGLYFGVISGVTLPVCTAVYTAVAISKGNTWDTGLKAMSLALPVYVLPWFFITQKQLLLMGPFNLDFILAVLTAITGAIFLGVSWGGSFLKRLHLIERLAMGIASILLWHVSLTTDLVGIIIIGCIAIMQKIQQPKGNIKEL
jgi:TRAP transporter 4TM/12TM fusion protein